MSERAAEQSLAADEVRDEGLPRPSLLKRVFDVRTGTGVVVRATPGLLLLTLAISAGSCTVEQREEPAEPPLKTLFYSGTRLVVTLADDVHLAAMVDLGAFGTLRPGMTAADARAAAGAPEMVEERDGITYYRYRTTKATVELSEERADDSVDPKVRVWRIRAFPDNAGSGALFHPRIAALLSSTLETLTVNSATEGVTCRLDDGPRVRSLRWHRHYRWYE